MKKFLSLLFILMSVYPVTAQDDSTIYLLVRADDIGSFQAANTGCIEAFQNGIARSVELMPVCAWFPEAVVLLKENKDYDVGIHLTLTSEWSKVKWRPLTNCPGLVDDDGFFFPMVWKNSNFPPNSSISESNWTIEEIEQELRAQIELSLKYLPHISHLSAHMGFTGLDPKIEELVNKLAKEYGLEVDLEGFQRMPGWGREVAMEDRIDRFCENLENLTPGKYLFVEHPAKNSPEMQPVGHTGYMDVAADRDWVLRVFTSEKVKEIIRKKSIRLVSYADYRK